MPPRPKKPSERATSKLLEAAKFCSSILKEQGAPYETHLLLQNKTIIAFNGTMATGAIIDEELYTAPSAKTFVNALSKCMDGYSITELDKNKLSVKSGKFRAVVSCIDPVLLYNPSPDNPVCPIDDRFKTSLSIIDKIKIENGQKVYLLTFLLNGPSIIATDGKIILEAWHGLDLPSGLPIPKIIIPTILGTNKKLSSFGFSHNSVTFFFEDNSWVKTTLYAEQWPENVKNYLNLQANLTDLPIDFYNGIDAISSFVENGVAYFDENILKSHKEENIGASFEVQGIKKGSTFSIKYLSMVKDLMQKVDFNIDGNRMLYFVGNNVRGIIAGYG